MSKASDRRRVVVTGQGVVSPIGIGVDNFWSALQKGQCGIGQIEGFDTGDLQIKIAGEVKDFEPRERLDSKQLLLADKYSQFAGYAARDAIQQSGLEVPIVDDKGLSVRLCHRYGYRRHHDDGILLQDAVQGREARDPSTDAS